MKNVLEMILSNVILGSCLMADGVIGNTTGFDPVILGSSPGRPA